MTSLRLGGEKKKRAIFSGLNSSVRRPAPRIHVYLEPQDGPYLGKGSLQMSLGPNDKCLEEKRREEKGKQTQGRRRNEDGGRGRSDATSPFARKRDIFRAQEAASPGFSV